MVLSLSIVITLLLWFLQLYYVAIFNLKFLIYLVLFENKMERERIKDREFTPPLIDSSNVHNQN